MPLIKTTVDASTPTPPPMPICHNALNFFGTVHSPTKLIVSSDEAEEMIINQWESLTNVPFDSDCRLTYSHLNPIIQEGPTCGLVALYMLAMKHENLTLRHIFHIAKALGYTKQGEMFSGEDMLSLAERLLGDDYIIQHFLGGMDNLRVKIFTDLHNGSYYLVPYDCDKNHCPTLRKGHKAHWAILCGVIENSEKSYVIARHGKSKYTGLWEFDKLASSNCNLSEIKPSKSMDDYVINDISLSLSGHYLCFQPRSQ